MRDDGRRGYASDDAGRVAPDLVSALGAGDTGVRVELSELNGELGSVALFGEVPVYAPVFEVDAGRAHRTYTVVNPDKLAALGLDGAVA